MRDVYRILVGKPEVKTPLGRPMHRWGDIIETNLKKTGAEGAGCSHLAQARDQ
jgi:hypothetical protein